MQVEARLKYLKGSAQKVRLVADLIRGKQVEKALNILRFTNKSAAKDLEKALLSAIANAESKEGFTDVDALYVKRITVDGGPQEKRTQPAPMGRAFRIIKRRSHITIAVADEK